MKLSYKIILALFLCFILWIFVWAMFLPKGDITQKLLQTVVEQQKHADVAFKDVTFEEVSDGNKYWSLTAKNATVNKSSNLATLNEANGTFYKHGKSTLRFRSPAAVWDMAGKEIALERPLGYDVSLENKIDQIAGHSAKKNGSSVFNLPKKHQKGQGFWFNASSLTWNLGNQKIACRGDIVLNKGEVTGFADRLESDVALDKTVLQGNPKIIITVDKTTPIIIEADQFAVWSAKDIIEANGSPRLFWSSAKVVANQMQYIQNNNLLKLNGNVKITYKEIVASGDKASYLTASETIILEGNATAVQGNNHLSGNKVKVALKDNKVSVIGKGKVIYTGE
ncbi:MAG: LptA/OstA family protein [Candidatus Margulisiibacteriota bacterium]